MTTALLFLAFVIGGLIHFKSHHSIFHWIAKACIVLDAVCIQAWRITGLAAVAWWDRLPATIAEVRAEVAR